MNRFFLPIQCVGYTSPDTHIQVARRRAGTEIGSSRCRVPPRIASFRPEESPSDPEVVQLVKLVLRGAAREVLAPAMGRRLNRLLSCIPQQTVNFSWRKQHDVLVDVVPGRPPTIRIATDVFGGLGISLDEKEQILVGDENTIRQAELLGACALLFGLSVAAGHGQRESLHAVLDFWFLLDNDRQQTLREAFHKGSMDRGAVFDIFLRSAANADLALQMEGIRIRRFEHLAYHDLVELGNQLLELLRSVPSHVVEVPKGIFRKVVTILNRTGEEGREVGAALRGCPDEFRTVCEAVLREIEGSLKWRDLWVTWVIGQSRIDLPYDHERVLAILEQPSDDIDLQRALINEAVVSTYDPEVEGFNIRRIAGWALENNVRLVGGRLSRAFGNQAHLLSVSRLITNKEELLRVSQEIYEQCRGIHDLETFSTRLASLMGRPGEISYALAVGAIDHLEEALIKYQSSRLQAITQEREEATRRLLQGGVEERTEREREALFNEVWEVFRLIGILRDCLASAPQRDAAYVVLLQRTHPAETINLANANAFREVHPGKEEDLKDLPRRGGHNTYASPGPGRIVLPDGETENSHWIIKVQDWIEAIPLFIHERVIRKTVDESSGQWEGEAPAEPMDSSQGGTGFQPVAETHDRQDAGPTRQGEAPAEQTDSSQGGTGFQPVAETHDRQDAGPTRQGEERVVEVIETEVDQEAMEAFFRLHAEYWARNIGEVMDSEHVALARELLVRKEPNLQRQVDRLVAQDPSLSRAEAVRQVLKSQTLLAKYVGPVAALIASSAQDCVIEVNRIIEHTEEPRRDVLARVLLNKSTKASRIGQVFAKAETAEQLGKRCQSRVRKEAHLTGEAQRLGSRRMERLRPVPTLHILTTESAGMTEGYVQSWIEEEMAVYNAIKGENLEGDVRERLSRYRSRLTRIGEKIIHEFAMDVVIDEVMAEQRIDRERAIQTVVMSFRPLADEVAKLAVLLEEDPDGDPDAETVVDPPSVGRILDQRRAELETASVPKVIENNGRMIEEKVESFMGENPDLDEPTAQRSVIDADKDYAEELENLVRFEARRRVLDALDSAAPSRGIAFRVRTYLRCRTSLALSTARKEVLAERNLQNLTLDPRYHYQAVGGNKRYNLLYTPSRVNLGERERDSVVKWRQWVGGGDRAAARAGFEFYSLVNEGGVEERPALAHAEIQKTSENALCVTHFAGSNALALLIMAVAEGDAEDMADQMNLREDRMVLPAGEGYGGYCVPKDGLFLAFVLSLTNEVKLRQIGIPDHLRAGVMALAKKALMHQHDFESELDWQLWAARKLLSIEQMKEFFEIRDGLLVFQITKIAKAIERLGRPWPEVAEGAALVANLAARWGVEKMIICGEQVNRFMVFCKAWLIYECIREARSHNPLCPSEEDARIALSAEYKPVQDVRYSTGLRLLEIFARTGGHLTYSLDEEGQNLAYLMSHGFDPDDNHRVARRMREELVASFDLNLKNPATVDMLEKSFPSHRPPADIVMTSVTMSSIQDMLFYTTDTRLDAIAESVKTKLADVGLSEEQITANAKVYGGRLRAWAGVKDLPEDRRERLIADVGGNIHALVLKYRGPGRDYEKDVQGIDVLNTGIPFPELLELIDNPPKLVALMLHGNPNSSLAIADGCAGRKPRALSSRDVMTFFAACEKFGHRGVYKAIGLGSSNVERLRTEMLKKRERAETLYRLLEAVTEAPDRASRTEAIRNAESFYADLLHQIQSEDEAGKALREEERLKRFETWREGDAYISQALAKLSSGLPLHYMDFGTWIAGIGGVFVVNGELPEEITRIRTTFEKGINLVRRHRRKPAIQFDGMRSSLLQPCTPREIEFLFAALVRPKYIPETQHFEQQQLVESSSKAVEVAAAEALERRRALQQRAMKAQAFSEREQGFQSAFDSSQSETFDAYAAEARGIMTHLGSDLQAILAGELLSENVSPLAHLNRQFGALIARTRNALVALAEEIVPTDNLQLCRRIGDDLAVVFSGREIVLEDWKRIAGGYEDIGDLARMAEAAEQDKGKLARITEGIEFFYVTFALAQTLEFVYQQPDEFDTRIFWRNITDFFAETVNDHQSDYSPWAYSRGSGFQSLSSEELYEPAVKHHQWLYEYIRSLLIHRTELAHCTAAEQDHLLGDFTGSRELVSIGANASTAMERRWRAYNQIREICFMRSDGFPIPLVFDEFNPDIIDADRRVNITLLYPVGRTHVSRALREGPTLNRELEAQGKRGANVLITRMGRFAPRDGARKPVLEVDNAHLYVTRVEFAEALRQHRGLSDEQIGRILDAEEQSGRLHPKGIRLAVRFSRPVVVGAVIPYHGLPIYESGDLENIGLPATVQSLVFSDITYDKSLYPEIYDEKSGVTLPPEIDWKQSYNEGISPRDILARIENGIPDNAFIGVKQFAREHPIVLIKGAAESGARNLKVFDLQNEKGTVKSEAVREACEFVYDVSRGQNVVIQAAVLTSPEFWASDTLMRNFVDRQILEWNMPVSRESYPRSQIYCSLRVVVCASGPDTPYELAFPIILLSLQVATNIGRGGTLEPLRDELVQEQYQNAIRPGLEKQAPKVMAAMARYAKKYAKTYRKQRGRDIGKDLRGVSYAWPPYLMLDFLVTPVFKRPGRLVDIEPEYDENGHRIGSKVILQDEQGRFEGEISDWKFIHLEPNVGIGLWDRYTLREEEIERQKAEEEGRDELNWDAIGTSDRIVLRNFAIAGAEYLKANFGLSQR